MNSWKAVSSFIRSIYSELLAKKLPLVILGLVIAPVQAVANVWYPNFKFMQCCIKWSQKGAWAHLEWMLVVGQCKPRKGTSCYLEQKENLGRTCQEQTLPITEVKQLLFVRVTYSLDSWTHTNAVGRRECLLLFPAGQVNCVFSFQLVPC